MAKEKVDLIIVGQGLAGSILANQALLKKKTLVVFENHHKHTASKAAIGMHNPLIIKRLRKSWRAKQFISYAKSFYANCESILGRDCRKDLKIARPFSSKSEEDLWYEKIPLEAWQAYIGVEDFDFPKKKEIAGSVKMGGWLDVNAFINRTKTFLKENDSFHQVEFEHDKLIVDNGLIEYGQVKADHIVFCEGYKMKDNPYFKTLPMQEVKGEILVVEDKNIHLEFAIKGPFYLVPIGNNQYKIGATFDWESLDESISKKAQEKLIEAVQPYLSNDFKVIDQIGGVRPTVKDRKPLIGTHKDKKNVHLFNGLGTRGVTLGPYFSAQLLDSIYLQTKLDSEVDISRFN